MDKLIFKNFLIFMIIIGSLIYVLHFLDPKKIITSLTLKEHLVNLYKPNKVFYHDNKIYLIDTHQLIDNNNPKIFNSFEDFQKYILNLEEKHLIKLPVEKSKIFNGVNTIKPLKYDKDNSIGKDFIKPFQSSKKCIIKESICNFNNDILLKRNYEQGEDGRSEYVYEETDLYSAPIFSESGFNFLDLEDITSGYEDDITAKKLKKINSNQLRKYKQKNCNINHLDEQKCKEIDDIMDMDEDGSLNQICFVEKKDDLLCRKYNNYRWNYDLLKNFCVKNPSNYSQSDCLIGDYFKDNPNIFN